MPAVGWAMLLVPFAALLMGCSSPGVIEEEPTVSVSAEASQPSAAEPEQADTAPPGDEVAQECTHTGIMTELLTHEQPAKVLSESPLAPTIAAAQVGARLPPLSHEAATWTDPERGWEALTIAAWLGCPPMAQEILDAGVPAEGLLEDNGSTPAIEAASAGQWGVVQMLLDAGADPLVEARGDPHSSVLSKAMLMRKTEVVQLLLRRPDVLSATAPGGPLADALESASIAGWHEGAAEVLNTGVRPPVGALLQAAESTSDREIFDLLISAAETADYADAGSHPLEASHLEMVCEALSESELSDNYRPGALDRIADVLGDVLPC